MGMKRYWHPNAEDSTRSRVGEYLGQMGELLVLSVAYLGGTENAERMSAEDMNKRVDRFKATTIYKEFRELAGKTSSEPL